MLKEQFFRHCTWKPHPAAAVAVASTAKNPVRQMFRAPNQRSGPFLELTGFISASLVPLQDSCAYFSWHWFVNVYLIVGLCT